MAIQKLNEMPTIPVEYRSPPQKIIPSIPAADNSEVLGKRNPVLTPITDASINEEVTLLQRLRDSQNDLRTIGAPLKSLSGTKNLVIYYSQAQTRLNNDTLNVVAPSPVNATKYDRIDNMIILSESELQDNFTLEDGHVQNDLTFSGFMYPGTNPKTNDLFWLNDIGGHGVLYLVTSVQPIAMIDFTGWKLEFQKHQEQISPEQMRHLIQDWFVFKFENVGTDRVTILQHKIAEIYDAASALFSNTTTEYLHRFYDTFRNIIRLPYVVSPNALVRNSEYVTLGKEHEFISNPLEILPDITRNIFDPFVMWFLEGSFDNEKLQYKGFSIFPTNPVWIGEEYKKVYKYSIYNAFTHQRPDIIKYYYHYPVKFNAITLKDLAYENWYYFELLNNQDSRCVDIFPPGFIARMQRNLLYDEDDEKKLLKYNLFIKFCNVENYIPEMHEIEPFMKDIDLVDDLEFYGYAPLLMYICYTIRQTVGKRIS